MKRTGIIEHEYYNAEGGKNFYKGTSFRIHEWSPDTYYFNDERYVDWVIYKGAICICSRTHVSNNDNAPSLVYKDGVPIGMLSNPCWQFALGGSSVGATITSLDLTRLKIENNILYISNDEGNTWRVVGNLKDSVGDIQISADVTSVIETSGPSTANVSVGPNNHLQFSFALQKGKDGADGTSGKDGIDGSDGKDGNGLDYIFTLTETPEMPIALDPSLLEANQSDNFVPDGWDTFALQVSETLEYQWTSTRKKINGVWGKFSKPVILNSYATEGIVPEVSFTSFIFCRTNGEFVSGDSVPTGGTYMNPFPTNPGTIGGKAVTWYDSVPSGNEKVWMSTYTFTNKENYDNDEGGNAEIIVPQWSAPRHMTDTANFQVEYSQNTHYITPEPIQKYYDEDPINYEENWRTNNTSWSDEGTNAIWMATATMRNGVWSDWSINKIKGEDGKDGTPINIIAVVETVKDLPECATYNGNIGDAYVVINCSDGEKNHVWIYRGDDENCWIDVGALGGVSSYIHIKYANIMYNEDNNIIAEDGYWIGYTRVEDETPGETPGDYIGMYTDAIEDDSMDPAKYTWKRWTGEDGWGYEYIYKGTKENIAPDVPGESLNINGWVPEDLGWKDDPVSISETMQYCWMCYRRKENNTWGPWRGAKDSNKAALWAKWGEQGNPGQDGAGVEYIFALSSIKTDDFSKASDLEYPDNNWAYDDPQWPWTDEPQSVSSINPVQWVSERIKPQGSSTWNEWSTPTVWNTYGFEGPVSTIIKVWQRSVEKLDINSIDKPHDGATFDFTNNTLTFNDGNSFDNGWSSSEITYGGRYLYSLGARITTTEKTVTLNSSDWTILTLESVDGQDGTGQSAVTMTVDPDTVLINVDDDNKTRMENVIQCSSNYYYGTSLQATTISFNAPEGIIVPYGGVVDLEHVFNITIPSKYNLNTSIPVEITLTPTSSALEGEDGSIISLNSLTKRIYLIPIKSNDTYSIYVSQDQVLDQGDGDWETKIDVYPIKNGKKCTDSNVVLKYIFGSETPVEFSGETFTLNSDNIDDAAELTFILYLIISGEEIPILSQTVSILKNGSDGISSVISNIYEYYLWSNDGENVVGFDGTDVSNPGQNITVNDDITWTANKPNIFDPLTPYLWNIELIEITHNGETKEYNVTEPALISKSGKGITKITEYYLISDQSAGVEFETNADGSPNIEGSEWSESYDYTKLDDTNKYVWNVEVIEYDDGTYYCTPPNIVSMYSKGEDGQSIGDIFEYYIYTDGTEPTPDWDNYSITWGVDGEITAGTLSDSSVNTEWTQESIPQMPEGKPCLWNVEVIAYADSGDGYDHTSVVLLSNRAMEIKSIDEYYIATPEEKGVVFDGTTIGLWTKVGPNEAVPITNETNKYLWNAELITYVDGKQVYSVASRIGVFIKGDKGDPGENANNLVLEFSDDMNAISVNSDNNCTSDQNDYHNDIKLFKGNTQIPFASWKITSIPNISDSDGNSLEISNSNPSVTIDTYSMDGSLSEDENTLTFELSIAPNTKIDNTKLTFLVEASANIDGETLSVSRQYNIIAIKDSISYQIYSDYERLECDYTGKIKDINNTSVANSIHITSTDGLLPEGYTLWVENNNDPASMEGFDHTTEGFNHTIYTVNGNKKYYWYKYYLIFGNEFDKSKVRDFILVEIGWGDEPKVTFSLTPNEFIVDAISINDSSSNLIPCEVSSKYSLKIDDKPIYLRASQEFEIKLEFNAKSWNDCISIPSEGITNQSFTFKIPEIEEGDDNKNIVEKEAGFGYVQISQNGTAIADAPVYFNVRDLSLTVGASSETINLYSRSSAETDKYTQSTSLNINVYLNDTELSDDYTFELDSDHDNTNALITAGLLNIGESTFNKRQLFWYFNVDLMSREYYKVHSNENDLLKHVIDNRANLEARTIQIKATHKSSGLSATKKFVLTSSDINSNYYSIIFVNTPNILTGKDKNELISLYLTSYNDDYVTIKDLDSARLLLKYKIDGGDWIQVNENHTIINGNYVWNPLDIESQIEFIICDKQTSSIILTYESIERATEISTITDYFNNLPNEIDIPIEDEEYELLDEDSGINYSIEEPDSYSETDATIENRNNKWFLKVPYTISKDSITILAKHNNKTLANRIVKIKPVINNIKAETNITDTSVISKKLLWNCNIDANVATSRTINFKDLEHVKKINLSGIGECVLNLPWFAGESSNLYNISKDQLRSIVGNEYNLYFYNTQITNLTTGGGATVVGTYNTPFVLPPLSIETSEQGYTVKLNCKDDFKYKINVNDSNILCKIKYISIPITCSYSVAGTEHKYYQEGIVPEITFMTWND